jgi:rRNA-processing protein FCF1
LFDFFYLIVVVDVEFLISVLHYKIDIIDQLNKLFQGQCRLHITPCILREIHLKENFPDLVKLCKKFQTHYCDHPLNYSVRECLLSLAGFFISMDTILLLRNFYLEGIIKRKFCMAVENVEHLHIFRCFFFFFYYMCLAIPGIPIIHMNRNVVVIETPSKSSLEYAQEV